MTISGKGTALVITLLLGGMGSVVAQEQATGTVTLEPISVVGEAPAPDYTLEEGSNPSHMLPSGVDSYRISVDENRSLRVVSEQWSEGSTAKLSADLIDDQGRIVASSSSDGADFVLGRQLAPGSYILEVRASRLSGGWNRLTQRYRLVLTYGP